MGTLFFWASKLVWSVLSPDSLLLILLVVSWVLLRRGKQRLAGRMLGYLIAVLIVIAVFPIDEWVMYPLESRFPTQPDLPGHLDGIIVLGGDIERTLGFMALARLYPEAQLVYSGGSGSLIHQDHSKADSMERLLEEQGLDLSRVTFEDNSRNTFENATCSMELVMPDPNETWVMVTSAWHMPRAVGVFNQVGWSVIPYQVDRWTSSTHLFRFDLNFADHLRNLTIGCKEWVGLLAYFATGRTSDLFPGPAEK